MSSLIKNLRIQNFKSIRDLSLDCERINVFIGKPNAGKSNILEAVSLLGVNHFQSEVSQKFADGIIRYRVLSHLFNNFDFNKRIQINADDRIIAFVRYDTDLDFGFILDYHNTELYDDESHIHSYVNIISPDGTIKEVSVDKKSIKLSPVKRYEFKELKETTNNGLHLQPPYGDNFYSIIESHPDIRKEIKEFLKPNGLELLLDIEKQRMTIVQKTESTLIGFPLVLIPDTFQRYIFHLAAIMSNRNSVLLFEEPESHSYGPYIYELAQHILNDEGGNQFFLTTHNPYLLLPLMQEGKDVAVFTTWFENYETHAKRLSEEEVREILDYGMDIFLNLDSFIPE